MKLKISEHQIQNQVISAGWLKGWFVLRLNSGKVTSSYTYKTNDKGKLGQTVQRHINLSEPGTPDLMLFKQTATGLHIMFFEIKTPTGKVTSLQAQKMKDLSRYGAHCYTVRSLDDAMKYL